MVTFVVPVIAAVALVFAATGHAAVLGVAEAVTGTVIVQLAPVICRPEIVIVFVPTVAVTVPPEHEPPAPPAAIVSPDGSVSVNEKAWVGLPAAWATVNVKVDGAPPMAIELGENAFVSDGVAAVTVRH